MLIRFPTRLNPPTLYEQSQFGPSLLVIYWEDIVLLFECAILIAGHIVAHVNFIYLGQPRSGQGPTFDTVVTRLRGQAWHRTWAPRVIAVIFSNCLFRCLWVTRSGDEGRLGASELVRMEALCIQHRGQIHFIRSKCTGRLYRSVDFKGTQTRPRHTSFTCPKRKGVYV